MITEKLFWWGPMDSTGEIDQMLNYVDDQGYAAKEYDPKYGQFSVSNLLANGYMEISWKSARAMGAPY